MSVVRRGTVAIDRVQRRTRPRGGVLMYHCIRRETIDPWAVCVTPEHFDEQMAVIACGHHGADLDEFIDGRAYRRRKARLAVTFDDGYLDNLTAALPILERHEIPATVFVVGNAVGRTREFWWDGLERAVAHDDPLPSELRATFGGVDRHFILEENRPADRTMTGWRADYDPPRTDRQRLFRELWDAIVILEPAEQDAAIDHLLDWARRGPADRGRALVDGDQFARLAGHPLITIGSHTLDHASLTDLTPARQRTQIVGGRDRVEELAGCPVDRFSYPFGRMDASARAVVAEMGAVVGCTSVPIAAVRGDDPLTLPRLQVTDLDGDAFARQLRDRHRLRCVS